jgi:CRISPR-associated protein Cas2
MLLVSYDISNDKLRARFAKFLLKYGNRLQYSVYEIKNSKRVIENLKVKIESYFAKSFEQSDSVFIFITGASCEIIKYGYAKNEDSDLIII